MTKRIAVLITSLFLLTSFACSEIVGPDGDRGLEAEAGVQGFSLTNHTDDTVHFIVIDRDLAARALLCFCKGGPTIGPNWSVRIDYESLVVAGQEDIDQINVYWWQDFVPAPDGGVEPDSVRSFIVEVPSFVQIS